MFISYLGKVFLYLLLFGIIFYISLCIFFSKYELIKIIYCFLFGIILIFYLRKFITECLHSVIIHQFLQDVNIYAVLLNFILIAPIIIKAPYLRFHLQGFCKFWHKKNMIIMGSKNTQSHILEAIMTMSQKKIGSLITIEKYNTLEQFAQKSISIDANVSKELLINIFMPNTPLHDGAVIIRGNKILSAGAYFMLSNNHRFEKTAGSRHRAALGISENTDSMTIVVSEETGDISIAIESIMLKVNDKNKIQEYLAMFMG
ncbi:diadenylate cyclase [Candidatus Phytoplasma melaleucae]|uniref:Diadenylate cyclase n=1 Tax=Candidatus Phytoplasma melaleucae TaxID=2982630 RepID=A0ABT9DDM9_9MOLU|nr:DNA integrity scanning protein DisA nucleotide-binding domain protein ['Melaleuca sp.' phytoplasma]MDO8168135.1 DNA integrity scanning protein DisA nucleotide-binding domain protein ['Melaleuca sp.' phytoplasma]